MTNRTRRAALLALCLGSAAIAAAEDLRRRLPQDEVVYFALPDRFENGETGNDRGGLTGDRLITGFDPTHKGFYHGGDLAGFRQRLDYLQALGATAIWLGPVYRNKPVQGAPGEESAGYHGYWITDFTRVDPHLGTDAQLRELVDAAHARGMKVYLDIITNHTADIIAYRECSASACPYRSRADFPYSTRGSGGAPINPGFRGDQAPHQTRDNFAKLSRADFAYTPFVPEGERDAKVPAWLNDPIYYHNRGNTTFTGESSQMGDFAGLDDLMTENPRVVQGFIEIYGRWIDRLKVDGFRIDTAKHVNPEFWQAFVPAMKERARRNGIPNFHIFGEVYTDDIDVASLARHTRVDRLPAVLDFAFAAAVRRTVAGTAGTSVLARLFADDPLYEGGETAALQLPTFLGNHDMGRFAMFVRSAFPAASDEEVLQRVKLAHSMLFTLRGVPVVYSGDEQGFVGRGNDQDARQDMFASRVASYNDQPLLGTSATTATGSFNTAHPLFRHIATLAQLRAGNAALRRGLQQVRNYEEKPGLFAVSRRDPATGRETIIAFNTTTRTLVAKVESDAISRRFRSLYGSCAESAAAPGSYEVTIPPLEMVVCAAVEP